MLDTIDDDHSFAFFEPEKLVYGIMDLFADLFARLEVH
jgi:hypothetical protein